MRISTRQSMGAIVSPAPGAGVRFGASVALGEFRGSGILLIGAPGEKAGFYANVGYVYVFSFALGQNGTTFQNSFVARLYSENPAANDYFGEALAMHGGRVVVGAPGPTTYPAGTPTVDDAGAAFVFDVSTYEQLAKLQPRDATFNAQLNCYRFGQAVDIYNGVVVVGAPKAKYPCARRTKSGAVFLFSVPTDGFALRSRDTSWWWGESGTYNQTAKLLPPQSDTTAGHVEFGYAVKLTTEIWNGTQLSILVVGAPAIADNTGAVFVAQPFDETTRNHQGLDAPATYPLGTDYKMTRILGPAYLGSRARYGAALDVDRVSGLMLVGAPGGYTAHGHAGVVLRTWILKTIFANPSDLLALAPVASTSTQPTNASASNSSTTANASVATSNAVAATPTASGSNATSNATSPPPAYVYVPPEWASLPLQDVPERTLWAPTVASPGDDFGVSLALAPNGISVIGASNASKDDGNGTIIAKYTGAAYIFEPILMSPSTPPMAPPPPWRPDWGPPLMPFPPFPPPTPPSFPPDMTHVIAPIAAGSTLAFLLLLVCVVLCLLRKFAPMTYRRVTKSCRKPPFKISEDNGRGPVRDQLRAVLAIQAEKTDVFAAWDIDRGGTASRKEFRLWWPRIGYLAPVDDINELFDEFDVDGSGEIDMDEFQTAFELRGALWKELGEQQKQHDENENLPKMIAELEKKLKQKNQQLIIDESAVKAIDDAMVENNEELEAIEQQLGELNASLAEHKARLDAFKGGIKSVMKKTAVVNAFKAAMSPDDAAAAIQARVRGRSERREVQAKLAEKRRAAAEAAEVDEVDELDDAELGATPGVLVSQGGGVVLGARGVIA